MAIRDLSRYLGNVRNRIYRVGIELEGAWTALPSGVNLIRDGSIMIPQTPGMKIGELPSPPMELIKVKPWLLKYYPQVVHQSCGLHVHMSFKTPRHYETLMERDFQDTVVAQLVVWAKNKVIPPTDPIWNRLAGKNQFCKLDFFPDEQARATRKNYDHAGEGNRYTAINYCFGLNGTVECRVLPMMGSVEDALGAVMTVIDTTNAYLVQAGKREGKVVVDVGQIGSESLVEHTEVIV